MNKVDKKFNFLIPIKTKDLIRLGANYDGGYVVNKSIVEKANILVSFGIGNDWSFELDFLKKNKKGTVNIYDHTTNIFPYIKNLLKSLRRTLTLRANIQNLFNNFNALKSYILFKYNKNIQVYFERVVSKKIFKYDADLQKVFNRLNEKEKKIILKIDIEGYEYQIVPHLFNVKKEILMIVVEYHDIEKNILKFKKQILELKKKYNIIHIHGNNHANINKFGFPNVLEITLLKKNKINKKNKLKLNFPIKKYDFPNNKNIEDIKFCFEN